MISVNGDQITEAIVFFENLTEIYSGTMSFIGPIPNEQLEKVRQRWLEWYRAHGAELTLDDAGAIVRGSKNGGKTAKTSNAGSPVRETLVPIG